jgi:transcriptional regulator with XRE-family HTH domain
MQRFTRRVYPNLTAYLDNTGQTQKQLAARLGRSQAYISKIINGLQQPRLHEALRISAETGVPVESLVSKNRNIPVGQS